MTIKTFIPPIRPLGLITFENVFLMTFLFFVLFEMLTLFKINQQKRSQIVQ